MCRIYQPGGGTTATICTTGSTGDGMTMGTATNSRGESVMRRGDALNVGSDSEDWRNELRACKVCGSIFDGHCSHRCQAKSSYGTSDDKVSGYYGA